MTAHDDDLLDDVHTWLEGQIPYEEPLAAALEIASFPATVEQNDVLDVITAVAGEHGGSVHDRWVPDWSAVERLEAPLDRQQLWAPLHQRDHRYTELLPSLEVSVHKLTRGSGRTIMLNGHVDVVPADGQGWTQPAFSPTVRDGRMIARGSMDMKAGLIASAYAYRYLAERWDGEGTVLLASVPEEETGGNGTLATLARGYTPDAAVFAEPTDLAVVHRHIGIQGFEIHTTGHEGGMLKRSWGVSAAPALAHAAVALERMETDRTVRARATGGYEEDDLPGFINFTIHAGDWPATRAGSGRIVGLMSVLPGESQDEAADELRTVIAAADPTKAATTEVIVWGGGHRGAELPSSHPLTAAFACLGAGDHSPGRPTRAGTMVCDAKIMHGGGWAPSIVLGPVGGSLHAADEWVDLQSISTLIGLLVRGVTRYLR